MLVVDYCTLFSKVLYKIKTTSIKRRVCKVSAEDVITDGIGFGEDWLVEFLEKSREYKVIVEIAKLVVLKVPLGYLVH